MKAVSAVAATLVFLGAGSLMAGDLPRPYFGSTSPGSWARYETTTSAGARTAATYTRLADRDGGFVVEIETEFLEGPGAGGGSTSIFVIEPGFDWQNRFLSFGKALSGASFVVAGSAPMEQAPSMVTAMRDSMADFGGGFDAGGSATHGGVECDVFSFRAVLGGPNPGTMTGETCLNAGIPFGLVHQKSTSNHKKSGESSFETVLVDHGTTAVRTLERAEARRIDVALAYQQGAVALDFRVPEGGDGRTLEVTLTNISTDRLIVAVGTSTYAFELGVPLGTFFFQPDAALEVELLSTETSEVFTATQGSGRGLKGGAFRLIMAQGVPKVAGDGMKVGAVP